MINNNMKVTSHKSQVNKGFTLIETLVAVLLLSTAIAGPLSIASKGLNATLVAKDQFIAFYLAQDAMEFIRYVRDSNTLGGGDWLTGDGAVTGIDLSDCASPNGCYVDSIQSTVTACGSVCNTLNYDSAGHFFTYAGSAVSAQKFIRTVKITGTSLADEAVVTVTVSWSDVAGVTHKAVIVRENLLNWQ